MNKSKHKKEAELIYKSIQKNNINQTERLLAEITSKSKVKKAKVRFKTFTLAAACSLILILSTFPSNNSFELKEYRHLKTKEKKVINKPDVIQIKMKEGYWLEVNKKDGSYQKIYIDSTILNE